MTYAATPDDIAARRKAFIQKWQPCPQSNAPLGLD